MSVSFEILFYFDVIFCNGIHIGSNRCVTEAFLRCEKRVHKPRVILTITQNEYNAHFF